MRRFFFCIVTFLCIVSYLDMCGARRRFKSRYSPTSNGIAPVVGVGQGKDTNISNTLSIGSPVIVQNDSAKTTTKKRNGKRRRKGLRPKRNNPIEQKEPTPEEKSALEPVPVPVPASENMIPKELEELDQREPDQEGKLKEEKVDKANDEETIEFYFENTDLQNVVTQIGQLYNVTFITDDIITPLANGNKALKGNKLSFKTHKPLTKKEGWNILLTFLDIAGFAIVPEADSTIFRITTVQRAQRAAIPSYIGVDSTTLPDSDQMIRYVYFIENINPETLKGIVDQMLSSSAGPSFALRELKALILTDKSYNIKTLMKIVKELDKVSMPQSMSVLKLKRADAEVVKKLYEDIAKTEDQNMMTRFFPARKQPTSLYFPENVRVIAEPRINALVLLGPYDAIEKIEDFVQKYIDVDPDKPYSPLHTYQMQYADASTVATIMNDVTKFGVETAAGKVGGVRGGDKYFKPMLFIPEPSTNQLIIRGDYEDYLKAVEVIKQLDEPQAQVAIEILILTVELRHNKELGSQIRSKNSGGSCGLLGNNVEFQTGNFGGKLETKADPEGSTTPGCQRLLGNLLKLVRGLPSGNTVVSLGCDAFGVWGVFKALETISNSEVVSNPFLLATNKMTAKVSVGEVRRLVTGTVIGTQTEQTRDDAPAKLDVTITPQINSDGMIVLDIIVDITQFLSAAGAAGEARSMRKIDTRTTVADDEVIALGGLIRNVISDHTAKTPLLGDIPLLGWLFKNREKEEAKGNLLILVSTKIIEPGSEEAIKRFTNKHIDDYYGALGQMYAIGQNKDPIHKLFFEESKKSVEQRVEDLLFKDRRQKRGRRKGNRQRRKRKEQQGEQKPSILQSKPIPKEGNSEKNRSLVVHNRLLTKQRKRQQISLVGLGDDCGESMA